MVLVDIDAATFNYFRDRNLPAQWPFPRRDHARVIEQLHRAGAKVIAFDVQFTEPTDPADDNALIEAIGRAGNMVLSTTEVGPHGATDVLGGEAVLQPGGRTGGQHQRDRRQRRGDPQHAVLDRRPEDVWRGRRRSRHPPPDLTVAVRRPTQSRPDRLRRGARHVSLDLLLACLQRTVSGAACSPARS